MAEFSVGRPYPGMVGPLPGGPRFFIGATGIELLMIETGWRSAELAGAKEDPIEVGLVAGRHVIQLVFRCRRLIVGWADATFAPSLVRNPDQIGLPARAPHQGRLMHLVCVDAPTAIIRAQRMVSLSPTFCAVLDQMYVDTVANMVHCTSSALAAEMAKIELTPPENAARRAVIREIAGRHETWQ